MSGKKQSLCLKGACAAVICCAVLASLSCATPPYSAGEAREVPQDFFGIIPFQRDLVPRDFEMMDELGVVWQRRTCRWSSLEPRQGEWDFSGWDAYVNDSKAAGNKLLAILAYDTAWLHGKENAPQKITPEELPHYLNYVETVVSRYKGRIDAYEIWNEPNISFWKGPEEDFFAMTRAAAQKIRELDPDAKIVGGSFWRAPRGFVKRIFESGALDHVDAVSFHPYAVNPKGAVKLYDKLVKILEACHFTGEIWVTEVGYPTSGWYPTRVKEENFPTDIVKTLAGLATRRIRVLFWYELKDSYNRGEAPSRFNSEYYFGISYLDHSRKNGYYAWALCGQNLAGAEYLPELPERLGLPKRTVSLCFRGPGNKNTLILWNEWGGAVNVRVTLPGAGQTIYDISTGEGSPLGAEAELRITRTPLFITWIAEPPPPGVAKIK
ncbi:MAG: beta-galactosidase [Treponema sp.]|nr:beta-galactosidase [Treponema sp.]